MRLLRTLFFHLRTILARLIHGREVVELVDELVLIGRKEDFLMDPERYDCVRCGQILLRKRRTVICEYCGLEQKHARFQAYRGRTPRHIRAREIGARLDEIEGLPLMQTASARIQAELGVAIRQNLDWGWSGVGEWLA